MPGKPEESELVARVFAADPDDLMPPPDSHKKLTSEQRRLLQEWIAGGAKWEAHWAYLPPQMPDLPQVTAGWSRNEIDLFIEKRLAEEGLQPSEEAGKRTPDPAGSAST